jgi:tetratricopeptide (TPR) repeat protein
VLTRAEALEVPPMLTLGLTLDGLQRACSELLGDDLADANGYSLREAARAASEADGLSLCERIQQQQQQQAQQHTGVATVYVIWHRSTSVATLLSALHNLVECTPCTLRTCFWLREASMAFASGGEEAQVRAVPLVIGAINHSVLVLERAHLYAQSLPLRCALCVSELAFSMARHCGFWLAMTDDDEDHLHLKLLQTLEVFDGTLAGAPGGVVDASRTSCRRGLKHETDADGHPPNAASELKALLGASLGFLHANVLVVTLLTKALVAEGRSALRRLPEPSRAPSKIALDLARLLQRVGATNEATALLQAAVSASQQAHGPADRQTLERQLRLAACYFGQDRVDEAAALLRSCFEVSRVALGDLTPETILAMEQLETLGMTLVHQGRRDALAAADCLRGPLAFHREHLGGAHPRFLSSCLHLGSLLATTAHRDEARALLVEAADGTRTAMGPDHPDAKRCADALAKFEAEEADATTIGRRMHGARLERFRRGLM